MICGLHRWYGNLLVIYESWLQNIINIYSIRFLWSSNTSHGMAKRKKTISMLMTRMGRTGQINWNFDLGFYPLAFVAIIKKHFYSLNAMQKQAYTWLTCASWCWLCNTKTQKYGNKNFWQLNCLLHIKTICCVILMRCGKLLKACITWKLVRCTII